MKPSDIKQIVREVINEGKPYEPKFGEDWKTKIMWGSSEIPIK